jgi:ABC-type branched-subunit amino acid transport system ATPase component
MLEILDVHTYYGDSHVLQGTTLRAERGQVTAILGRNGVGKTTLCRSLTGLTPARRGRIVIDESTSRDRPLTESARRASASCLRDGVHFVSPRCTKIFRSLFAGEVRTGGVDRVLGSFRASPSDVMAGTT